MATLCRRLERREEDFLDVVRRAVYEVPTSPYRALLQWAGCEYGDLVRAVRADGLEGALGHALSTRGLPRGRRAEGPLPSSPRSHDHPVRSGRAAQSPGGRVVAGAYERGPGSLDGGSRGPRLRPRSSREHLSGARRPRGRGLGQGDLGHPRSLGDRGDPLQHVRPARRATLPPGRPGSRRPSSTLPLESSTHAGRQPGSGSASPPADPRADGGSDPRRRMDGSHAASGSYAAPLDIRECGCGAVRHCPLAWAGPHPGAQATVTGEPVTAGRRAVNAAAGMQAVPDYGSAEAGGSLTHGCLRPPAAPDDMHFFRDLHALVRVEGGRGPLPDGTLLVTSLRETAPLILLNMSMGDRRTSRRVGVAVRSTRSAGALTSGTSAASRS